MNPTELVVRLIPEWASRKYKRRFYATYNNAIRFYCNYEVKNEKMVMLIDPSKDGPLMTLTDWQLYALRYLWRDVDEADRHDGSRLVHEVVNENLSLLVDDKGDPRSISRASIINFCTAMVEEGVLGVNYETCKGGSRGLYRPILTEETFIEKVLRDALIAFYKDFPDQTQKIVDSIQTAIKEGTMPTIMREA